jgi:hypothetical protein
MLRMQVAESGLVSAMCTSSIQEIDPTVGALVNDAYYGPAIASFVVRGDTRYTVSTSRVIYVQTLGSDETTATVLEGVRLPDGDGAVPYMDVGLSADGRYLAIPTATQDDLEALQVSQIVVVDLAENRIERTIQVSAPFIDIAFAPDGSTAFVTLAGAGDAPDGIARIDLASGAEVMLEEGVFAAVVAR